MKSPAAAFDRARTALSALGIPGNLLRLHTAGVAISHRVLGGSHSVAVYPPIDSLTPIDGTNVAKTIDPGRDISLYVHVAFCETQCTFCHYAVRHYSGRQLSDPAAHNNVAFYLKALRRELKFWGAKLAKSETAISSIYIGGGTPLVLDEHELNEILTTIRNEYEILQNAEICIEGSPLSIVREGGADKLRFLKENGVTRLSFGVQSFDDTVLKYAARGYKRDIPIRASFIVKGIFDNWNLDLIQGLYLGSPLETWENLQVISEICPPHLTWYHSRFADRPQGDWYKSDSKHASFEDEQATLLGRMLIWQEMAALGYHQTDGNRFMRERQYGDPFKRIRTSPSSNLLGTGAAAYSHMMVLPEAAGERGLLFRNQPDISRYADTVLSGDVPVATGRIINEEELLATSYATGLRNGRVEGDELQSIRRRYPRLSLHYDELVKSLCDLGVLERYLDDSGLSGLRFSTLGRLFEDEVLALFFSPPVKEELLMKGTQATKFNA